MIRRWHADVIAPVRVISVPLYLLRRDDDPLTVFASTSEQASTYIFDLGRVAVGFIATAFGRIVRHVPRAVKFFMELHVLRWMVMFLSLGRERQAKSRNKAHDTKEMHADLDQKVGYPLFEDVMVPALVVG
jgi:hypothetical protein